MNPGTTIRRPDADIFAEARHALDMRPTIPPTVRVHVDHGVATLTGSVRSAVQLAEVEDVVRNVTGVSRIVNDIIVTEAPRPEGFEPPDDRG